MSKIESGMRVVLEFNEAYNNHDVTRMMELMSEDCVIEATSPAPDGFVYSGKEEISRYWQDFFAASAQAHIKVEEIFGFGERCIMRWTYSWEDLQGGKGHVRGIDIFRVREGLIREKLSYVKG